MSDRHILTVDEAVACLPSGDHIHTFVANGMLLGADWTRNAVIDHITKAGGASLAGSMMMSMKYGLCLHAGRRLFCQHDPDAMAALEAKIAAEPDATVGAS